MPAFWSCRGSNAKGWLRRFCPLPLARCPMTGTAATASRQFCWKPLSNTSATRALATRPPTGSKSGERRGGERNPPATINKFQPRTSGFTHCVKTSPLHFASEGYGFTEYLQLGVSILTRWLIPTTRLALVLPTVTSHTVTWVL